MIAGMNYIIIGTGNICSTYINALGRMPESNITGFISRSGRHPEAAPELPVWSDLAEVDLPFDAVIITTPNGLHHKTAVQAASLGKHVLTEKPLDISSAAMDAMITACRDAGVTLSVSFQRRMNPDNLALKMLLDEGRLGNVFAADLSCKFWRPGEYYASAEYRGGLSIDGGGPFMQQAVHNLDLYQWLFGVPVEVKSMTGTFCHNIEAEDHGAALFRHENGMIGSVIASTAVRPGMPARMEVHTDRGSFITTDDRITFWDIEGIENPAAEIEGEYLSSLNTAAIADTSLHEAVIADFEEALRDGRAPLVTAESARATTELVLRIYDCA